MKSNEKEKNVNVDDVAVTFEVDSEVIEGVRKGEIRQLVIDINDDNQNLILENYEGNLVLVIDELPETFHGCYLYNNGVFPYAIKDNLQFLVLADGDNSCLTKILEVDTEPGTRFRFQGPGKPSVEDPNGDSCIWKVKLNVVPLIDAPKKYLMRWNPTISSFTESDYEKCIENMERGMFRMNWSIYEWEEARVGDMFYMMRVGDKKAGIVFSGIIASDPYVMDDWAGTSKRRLYVDLVCMRAVAPDEKPMVSLDMLQTAIPEINWAKGHSGVLLSETVAEKIVGLMDNDAPALN